MTLGDIIREYRKEHGLTMQEFAERGGMTRAYISMLEHNRNSSTKHPITPSIETYRKAAAAMNTSLEELLKRVDQESPSSTPAKTTMIAATPYSSLTPDEREHIAKLRSITPEHRAYITGQLDAFAAMDAKTAAEKRGIVKQEGNVAFVNFGHQKKPPGTRPFSEE